MLCYCRCYKTIVCFSVIFHFFFFSFFFHAEQIGQDILENLSQDREKIQRARDRVSLNIRKQSEWNSIFIVNINEWVSLMFFLKISRMSEMFSL